MSAQALAVPAALKNKAHQTAWRKGRAAREKGEFRFHPYGGFDQPNRSSSQFRDAWLAGYDSARTEPTALVLALLDVMLRCDPENTPRNKLCTDQEWDAAIALLQSESTGDDA